MPDDTALANDTEPTSKPATASSNAANEQPAEDTDIESVWERLRREAERLATLRVVTVVGEIRWDESAKHERGHVSPGKDARALLTEVNLVQGDIRSYIDNRFIGDASRGLREYHREREQQAAKIVNDNLQALRSLLHGE